MKAVKKILFPILLIIIIGDVSAAKERKELLFVKVDTLSYIDAAQKAYSKHSGRLKNKYKNDDDIYLEIAKITFSDYVNKEKNKRDDIVAKLQNDSAKLSIEIAMLKGKIALQEQDIRLKDDIIRSNSTEIKELTSKITQADKTLTTLSGEIAMLKGKITLQEQDIRLKDDIIRSNSTEIKELTSKITQADKILTTLTGSFDTDYKNYQSSKLDNLSSDAVTATINKVSPLIEFLPKPEYQEKIRKLEAFREILSIYQSGKEKLKIRYNEKEINFSIKILNKNVSALFSDMQKKEAKTLAENLSEYNSYSERLFLLMNEINQLEDRNGRLLDEKREDVTKRINQIIFAVTGQNRELSFNPDFEYLNDILDDFVEAVKKNPNDHATFNILLKKIK